VPKSKGPGQVLSDISVKSRLNFRNMTAENSLGIFDD
jgi:hypothetical protein